MASWVMAILALVAFEGRTAEDFRGRFFRGAGDGEYLRLLDNARRLFAPDPEYQNLAMLYYPAWNGLVEGPTWDAWWVQNSYGPTYAALPFLVEPFVTFLQNSQDLWFDQMGDGQRVGAAPPFDWVAPDGCLCDAARPGWIVYRQGDGRTHLHDWGLEFTAAGLLLQSELLLIQRDPAAVGRYLPKLERCARFIETRRDPERNLFLVGAAGNLLAPSFAGWKKPDGTYDKAYHAGLSVTYIAALERLIELQKFAGRPEEARVWTQRREDARRGLAQLTTDEGYFINSLDPDGTRHGVYGAARHGYFESSVNHDAIAFRVVDEAQAERIYAKIASIPGLRPYHFILPNHPSYDDMYEAAEGLWAYGTWVNGGHWSTCEARMMLGYYRLGKFEDARRSWQQLLTFAERFRMDNPLVKFGSDVYQPGQPINLTYDAFGPPAAFVRGLFDYRYAADGLTVVPQVPPGITRLEQHFPVRLGTKRLYLATVGAGPVTAVAINGVPWTRFDARAVSLPADQLPDQAAIELAFGGAKLRGWSVPGVATEVPAIPPHDRSWQRLKRANLATNSLPFRIGADSQGGNRFRGEIAAVHVLRRALDPQEIAALARREAGDPLRDDALVGAWSFAVTESGLFGSTGPSPLPARRVESVGHAVGIHGPALRLEGTGYVEVAPQPALDFTEAGTFAAWIAPESFPAGGMRILDKSEVGTSNGFLLDTHPGRSLRLITQAGTLDHPAQLEPSRWTHVAGTVSADGRLALYVDGQPVAERAGAGAPDVGGLLRKARRLEDFHRRLVARGLAGVYEAAHARLALESLATAHERFRRLDAGTLRLLAEPRSQVAADHSYLETAQRLVDGLVKVLNASASDGAPEKAEVIRCWEATARE